jgi:hypothetical protein
MWNCNTCPWKYCDWCVGPRILLVFICHASWLRCDYTVVRAETEASDLLINQFSPVWIFVPLLELPIVS